jgi:peroxiredoxin family protein
MDPQPFCFFCCFRRRSESEKRAEVLCFTTFYGLLCVIKESNMSGSTMFYDVLWPAMCHQRKQHERKHRAEALWIRSRFAFFAVSGVALKARNELKYYVLRRFMACYVSSKKATRAEAQSGSTMDPQPFCFFCCFRRRSESEKRAEVLCFTTFYGLLCVIKESNTSGSTERKHYGSAAVLLFLLLPASL